MSHLTKQLAICPGRRMVMPFGFARDIDVSRLIGDTASEVMARMTCHSVFKEIARFGSDRSCRICRQGQDREPR